MKRYLLLLILVVMTSCGGTVAPTVRQNHATQIYGNVSTKEPYIFMTKDGSYVLNDAMRDEYNSLIKTWGAGTKELAIDPPLKEDAGIKPLSAGKWLQDGQHQTDYRNMKQMKANGLTPRTFLQKVLP